MPGTVVRDAIAPDLLADVDLEDEGAAQNGTAWEALWPGHIQFILEVASVTGSTPTLDLTIQGSESATFTASAATPVVDIATFSVGDEADGTVFGFDTYVDYKYVRAVADVGGTTVVYTATLKPVLPHDRRQRGVRPSVDTPTVA